MSTAKRQAIEILDDIAIEWFGLDEDRSHWKHCEVTDDGAVYIGHMMVGKAGTLSGDQLKAVRGDSHRMQCRRWAESARGSNR